MTLWLYNTGLGAANAVTSLILYAHYRKGGYEAMDGFTLGCVVVSVLLMLYVNIDKLVLEPRKAKPLC